TISLRSLRDRDHEAGYTDNNAAQPSVPISGKTLSGTIARPMTATSLMGLGCAKTQTCCGAVEWRSQASNVLAFSREARLLSPTDAQAQKSRNFRGSYTSVAPLTSCLFVLLCVELSVIWRRVGIGFITIF